MNALIVTGERSAENYASLLVDELKKLGNFEFYSICSNILDTKTIKLADYRDISIIGAKEALPILKKAIKTLKETKNFIKENNIELVILMDFPEFNLKIARFAKKLGTKVVYYITPQVWAWRKYRIKQLAKFTDLTIPILPFERIFFSVNDLKNAHYFGHPLVDILHGKIGKHKKENIILIMPGSRKSEIAYNAKTMFEAAKLIKEKYKYFKFIWIFPEHLNIQFAKELKRGFDFIKIEHNPYEFMDKAYFGILKSGTTTLEAALFGLPMTVIYRISNINYLLGKVLIKKNIKYISLPNLILGKPVVKELIHKEATKDKIFEDFERIHNNPQLRNSIRQNLLSLWQALGNYPVTSKIAQMIMTTLRYSE